MKYSIYFRFKYVILPFLGMILFVLPSLGCKPQTLRTFPNEKGNISVVIGGLRSDNGDVVVSLFENEIGFPDSMELALQNIHVPIQGGEAEVSFKEVPYGQYAISVLHDEDKDLQMKQGLFGQPLEGFGFSGFSQSRFGPPSFQKVSFYLLSQQREIRVWMEYETIQKNKQNYHLKKSK